MAFSELIQHAGNFGRFQIILVISTFSLIILLSTDNLVENFSAAIPAHRCYVHLLDNITSKSKLSWNLSTEALLRISIPMNANKQEQCRQFRQTQWQLLNSSDLTINSTELEMEPCLDGWTYDQSIFTSTIVTKWDLVCKSQSLRLWSRSIYLTGYVIGTPAVGYITDKWLSESARWMIISGKLDKALKELKKVAHINGRKDEENLHDEVLQSAMKEELIFLKNSSKKTKVMTSPVMCKTAFLLCFTRFCAVFYFYGLLFDLQNLGSNMFLSQALLGAVDSPSKFLSYFALKFLKRWISTAFVLFLGGCCILINIFVPQDLPFVCLGIAMLGKGSVAIFLSISVIYSHELIPTGIRSRIEGVLILTNGMGSILGSTIVFTKQYFEHLPKILCGTLPIVTSIYFYFLLETFNFPLPDTLQDMERRYKNYKEKSTKEEEIDNL